MGLTFEGIMNYCKTNKIIFNEIKDNLNNIVPFVGAGLSAFAYPLWKKALEDLTAFINNKNTREEIKALIDKGLLEDAAQEIEDKRGKHNLANDLLSVFSANKLEEEINSLYKQNVYLLPYIFKGAIITTNYDLIIENVYRQVLNNLNMPVLLPGKPELINQYLGQRNRPVIYKVHGEIQKEAIDYSSIIFTKKQYDEKYTKDSQLVKELKKCFTNNIMLFLGCSLEKDRTLEVLKMITKAGIDHYGIISCKEDEMDERIKQLAEDYHIRVICYPDNKHEAVRIILEKLLEDIDREKYQRLDYHLSKIDRPIANRFVYNSNLFPFVGRNEELKLLREFCKNKDKLWWAITGAGGSGKSRLAYEFEKELKNQQWHVYRLGHSNYDDLRKISDSCCSNTLFIADYVQGHIEKIAKWLEKIVNEKRSFIIKILLIERDSSNQNNNTPWYELLNLYANNSGELKNVCYQESFLELKPLSDSDLKEIMRNYIEEYSHNEIDEDKLLKVLEDVDKDLKRPLYALFISDACLNDDNLTKWSRNEILDYMYDRENGYYHNRINNLLNNSPNKKINSIVDKIRTIATIYDDISIENFKSKYSDIYNDLNRLIANIDTVESTEDFLNTIGLIEDDLIKAIKPDLIGEYFICKQIENHANLSLLFIENWEAEISVFEVLIRMCYDYGDLLNKNKDFIKKILLFNSNNEESLYLYSYLMLFLTYHCAKNDDIEAYFNKINVLLENDMDEKIAESLANSLFNLIIKQEIEGRKKIVTRIEKLNKRYPKSKEIVLTLAKSLVNLILEQELKEIKKTVARIEELNKRYPESEEIAVRLAKSLFNLTVKQGLMGIEKTITRIEKLNKKYPESEEIAVELAKSLFNLTVKQELIGIGETVTKLEKLAKRYSESEEIVTELAKSLVNLTAEQEIEEIEKTISKIEELNKRYPKSEGIAVELAKSLVNLTTEQEIKEIEKTVTRIEELNIRYPESEEIAVRLAKSLVNLTAEQEIEGGEKTVARIEELNNRYPENKKITLALVKLLGNLIRKEVFK